MTHPVSRLNAAPEGRYRIERTLGEGGMATVYLAEDLRHGRPVAVKVLKPELAAVIGAERFLAEIRTTANLHHPHILPLHDSGEADGLLFYVMPYVEGESLRERLDRERQLPVDEAVRIATNMAEALESLLLSAEKRRRFGGAARNAAAPFDIEHNAAAMIALADSISAQRDVPPERRGLADLLVTTLTIAGPRIVLGRKWRLLRPLLGRQ